MPTGADQPAVVRMAHGLPAAARLVLERCVQSVGDGEPDRLPSPPRSWSKPSRICSQAGSPGRARCRSPVGVRHRLPRAVRRGDYLFRELRSQEDGCSRSHQLALRYHWSEAEIMAMPTGSAAYLELPPTPSGRCVMGDFVHNVSRGAQGCRGPACRPALAPPGRDRRPGLGRPWGRAAGDTAPRGAADRRGSLGGGGGLAA